MIKYRLTKTKWLLILFEMFSLATGNAQNIGATKGEEELIVERNREEREERPTLYDYNKMDLENEAWRERRIPRYDYQYGAFPNSHQSDQNYNQQEDPDTYPFLYAPYR